MSYKARFLKCLITNTEQARFTSTQYENFKHFNGRILRTRSSRSLRNFKNFTNISRLQFTNI